MAAMPLQHPQVLSIRITKPARPLLQRRKNACRQYSYLLYCNISDLEYSEVLLFVVQPALAKRQSWDYAFGLPSLQNRHLRKMWKVRSASAEVPSMCCSARSDGRGSEVWEPSLN